MTQSVSYTDGDKLPSLLWLWVPLVFFIINAYLQVFADASLSDSLLVEEGPYENAQAIILAVCTVIGCLTIPKVLKLKVKWLSGWIILATLACFYICGEEISWGQHIFHWATPENWDAVNDHYETNLHNTSAWLDQHPRNLLEIAILVGGIIIPLLRKYKPGKIPEQYAIIYPPMIFWVTAAILWTIKFTKDLDHVFHFTHLERTSELNEVYMYYFMLLYLIVFKRRIETAKVT